MQHQGYLESPEFLRASNVPWNATHLNGIVDFLAIIFRWIPVEQENGKIFIVVANSRLENGMVARKGICTWEEKRINTGQTIMFNGAYARERIPPAFSVGHHPLVRPGGRCPIPIRPAFSLQDPNCVT